jgi:DUF971 family protein
MFCAIKNVRYNYLFYPCRPAGPFQRKAGLGLICPGTASTLTPLNIKPLDIQPIGAELAIKWDNGGESFIPLEKLRRHCPCAACKGEMDVMGRVYKGPDKPFPPRAFVLVRVAHVGGYAVQPVWGDGHATGIYSFDYLQKVADAP